MTMFAYAKINLGLAIIGRREDGYHNLQSIMQSIELHDVVRVQKKGERINCQCGNLSGKDNLAYKATELFLNKLGQEAGIEIQIEKQIPIQAGLGGGSSDAAATLRALNLIFKEPLTESDLQELAARCGADVPFCLTGGTMWATETGEQLERLPSAPLMNIVLIKPKKGVNTAEAYRRFDVLRTQGALDKAEWRQTLENGQVQDVAKLLCNDLEPASASLVPEVFEIKKTLLEAGCYNALMAGSGSAVFGIARDEEHAAFVAQMFRGKGYLQVWNTKTRTNLGGRG